MLTGAVMIVLGLALIGGGLWLITLGGSWFYLLAGAGFGLAGGLLLVRRAEALWAWAVVVLGTLVWSLAEAGLDWWPLAARADVVFVIALWLLAPWMLAPLRRTGASVRAPALTLAGVLAVSAVVGLVALVLPTHEVRGDLPQVQAAPDQQGIPAGDWRAYGRTNAGDRYSPLTQITPANVKGLQVAWTFRTPPRPPMRSRR
jgi:quinoprotein glucose dehydrogenase